MFTEMHVKYYANLWNCCLFMNMADYLLKVCTLVFVSLYYTRGYELNGGRGTCTDSLVNIVLDMDFEQDAIRKWIFAGKNSDIKATAIKRFD